MWILEEFIVIILKQEIQKINCYMVWKTESADERMEKFWMS